jgi:hypothetical protein
MSGRVLKLARGADIRGANETGNRGERNVRAARLFSEEEKEDVTIDLMLAMAPLPD